MSDTYVRSELGGGASAEVLRSLLDVPRPAPFRTLMTEFNQPIEFSQRLNTSGGAALTGSQNLELFRDGTWRFHGHFRATGWPSYKVSLATHVAALDGTVFVFTAGGEVFGTNSTGSRESKFDLSGNNPQIRHHWAALKRPEFHRNLQHDVDLFGTVGDIAAFVGKVALATTAVGAVGLIVIVGLEAIDALNLQEVVLPGTVGIIVGAGVLLVFGGGAMIPALVAGVAAATTAAALVKQRRLTDDEFKFVDRIFKGTLERDRILLTNLLGIGERPFATPGPGSAILVNIGEGFEDPTRYTGKGVGASGTEGPGQLLVHELTHAWQIQHSDFIPGMMCTAILDQVGTLGGHMDVYAYGPPTYNWDRFNFEQQASIVDDWFAGRGAQAAAGPMSEDESNPYWRYIRDNIRAGVA